jgi:hypothetical protein
VVCRATRHIFVFPSLIQPDPHFGVTYLTIFDTPVKPRCQLDCKLATIIRPEQPGSRRCQRKGLLGIAFGFLVSAHREPSLVHRYRTLPAFPISSFIRIRSHFPERSSSMTAIPQGIGLRPQTLPIASHTEPTAVFVGGILPTRPPVPVVTAGTASFLAPAKKPVNASPSASAPRCNEKVCVFPAVAGSSGKCLQHDRQYLEPLLFRSQQPSLVLLDRAKFGVADEEVKPSRTTDRRKLANLWSRFLDGAA